MRRLLYLIVASVLLCFVSCKTTEENYRRAYERAVAPRDSALELGQTIYGMNRQLKNAGTLRVGDMSASMGSQFVAVTEGGGGIKENIKKYCVVAGQFKQVFTAKSMRERLVEGGYPGAFVVQTGEPYYYVIAGSTNDAKEALELCESLRHDQALQLRDPVPFILVPSQIR